MRQVALSVTFNYNSPTFKSREVERLSIVAGLSVSGTTASMTSREGRGKARMKGERVAKGGKKGGTTSRRALCSNFRASCGEKFEAKEKRGRGKREGGKEKRRKKKECFCPEEFPTERHN